MKYAVQIGLVVTLHWLAQLQCHAQQQDAAQSMAERPRAGALYAPARELPNYLTDVTAWDWRGLEGHLQVSIRIAKDSVVWGQPLVLLIAIKNSSSQPRLIVETRPSAMFAVAMADQHGQSVPQTRWGSFVATKAGGHGVQLDPGDALGYALALDVLYDVTMPGVYTIQVEKKSLSMDTSSEEGVQSNRLNIEIRQRALPDIHELLKSR